jgi:hypothetical protein
MERISLFEDMDYFLICELIKSLLIVRFHRLGSVRQQCCRKHSMEAHHFRNRWPEKLPDSLHIPSFYCNM